MKASCSLYDFIHLLSFVTVMDMSLPRTNTQTLYHRKILVQGTRDFRYLVSILIKFHDRFYRILLGFALRI